ncbi:unnamed protein product [Strongylus vulgaris]|uniref:Uncharacterized protein n=1 Tax=Strongylus vulgaris TaxID=40348 RepID=A0A3P7IL76_STRVU|nr:unnamed protein product [Strongylus vulgaris]
MKEMLHLLEKADGRLLEVVNTLGEIITRMLDNIMFGMVKVPTALRLALGRWKERERSAKVKVELCLNGWTTGKTRKGTNRVMTRLAPQARSTSMVVSERRLVVL